MKIMPQKASCLKQSLFYSKNLFLFFSVILFLSLFFITGCLNLTKGPDPKDTEFSWESEQVEKSWGKLPLKLESMFGFHLRMSKPEYEKNFDSLILVGLANHKKEISGFAAHTTNNKMELTAVIEAIKAVKKPSKINIYTDSIYVKDGITKWILNWRQNGWKGKDKKPIKNPELWQELDSVIANHKIDWYWVRGHNGDKYNEIADSLARNAIENHR